MSAAFGKSKSKNEQTFDPELKGALLNVFGTGKQVAQTPYTPYPYASIAPMSPTELAGMHQTAVRIRLCGPRLGCNLAGNLQHPGKTHP